MIVFDDDADTYFTRQVVFERLAAAKEKLPDRARAGDGAGLDRPGRDLPVLAGIGLLLPGAHIEFSSRRRGRARPVRRAMVKGEYDLIEPADAPELAGHAAASTAGGRQRSQQLRRVRQAVPRYPRPGPAAAIQDHAQGSLEAIGEQQRQRQRRLSSSRTGSR